METDAGETVTAWLPGSDPAEVYERELVPALFMPCADFLLAAAALRPGERVLDVACGTGIVARRAAERVAPRGAVTGLDINPGMLAVARSRDAHGAVGWHEGSALALPFTDGAFDAVLCQQGLQFFPDRPAALREMRRVLAPGGCLALAVWRSVEHARGFAALAQALARHAGPAAAALPPFSLGDEGELRGLLSGAGFQEVAISPATVIVRFPSPDDFVHAVAAGAPTMVGTLVGVVGEARRALLADVAETLRPDMISGGLVFSQQTQIATAHA